MDDRNRTAPNADAHCSCGVAARSVVFCDWGQDLLCDPLLMVGVMDRSYSRRYSHLHEPQSEEQSKLMFEVLEWLNSSR